VEGSVGDLLAVFGPVFGVDFGLFGVVAARKVAPHLAFGLWVDGWYELRRDSLLLLFLLVVDCFPSSSVVAGGCFRGGVVVLGGRRSAGVCGGVVGFSPIVVVVLAPFLFLSSCGAGVAGGCVGVGVGLLGSGLIAEGLLLDLGDPVVDGGELRGQVADGSVQRCSRVDDCAVDLVGDGVEEAF